MDSIWQKLGVAGAVIMPLSNIPLMVRIIRRRTSQDISIFWALGVWSCLVLMLPSSLQSSDFVLKAYGISNLLMFSLVIVIVIVYRKGLVSSDSNKSEVKK